MGELRASDFGEGLQIFYKATGHAGLVASMSHWWVSEESVTLQVHANSMHFVF